MVTAGVILGLRIFRKPLMHFRFLTLTISLFAFLLAGCEKDERVCSECVTLQYNQTLCADPWGYGTDGSDIAVEYAVRDFFASNGVSITTVTVAGEQLPVTCAACTCLSGKTIYVLVDPAVQSTFTSYGFY